MTLKFLLFPAALAALADSPRQPAIVLTLYQDMGNGWKDAALALYAVPLGMHVNKLAWAVAWAKRLLGSGKECRYISDETWGTATRPPDDHQP